MFKIIQIDVPTEQYGTVATAAALAGVDVSTYIHNRSAAPQPITATPSPCNVIMLRKMKSDFSAKHDVTHDAE